MKTQDRFRAVALVLSVASLIVAILLIMVDWEYKTILFGKEIGLRLSFLIATFGILVHLIVIHALIFAGKATSDDISLLALVYIIYTLLMIPFTTSLGTIGILATFFFGFIILGIEYLIPDWPLRLYKALRKNLIPEKNKLKQVPPAIDE